MSVIMSLGGHTPRASLVDRLSVRVAVVTGRMLSHISPQRVRLVLSMLRTGSRPATLARMRRVATGASCDHWQPCWPRGCVANGRPGVLGFGWTRLSEYTPGLKPRVRWCANPRGQVPITRWWLCDDCTGGRPS
jgi:hypothetical protein